MLKTELPLIFASALLLFSFLGVPSNAQEAAKNEDAAGGKKWHVLEFKKSGRTIRIEKPPEDRAGGRDTGPGTMAGQAVPAEGEKGAENFTPTPTDSFAAEDHPPRPRRVNVTVSNQLCQTGPALNTAAFTVCNNEDRALMILNGGSIRFATADKDRFPDVIPARGCAAMAVTGDDQDLQFDCSGLFSLSFRVRLLPENHEGYFGVTIKRGK